MTFETKQKKRKAAASAPSPTAKKAKPAPAVTRSRKKAADFMSDGSDSEDGGWEALAGKNKKTAKVEKSVKKGKKEIAAPVAEKEKEKKEKKEKKDKKDKKDKKKVEKSNEEDVISLDVPAVEEDDDSAADSEEEEIDDQTATLLRGFESSDEEEDEEKEMVQVDRAVMAAAKIPDEKKVKKKVAGLKGEKSTPGVLYLGRIPHGFYEQEMRSYFSQFGTLTRLRLSRNKKTGRSKHYAFLEFADQEVARIVAETMDNYLLFGHILKCKIFPRDDLELIEKLFKGANKRFKPRPGAQLQKAVHERKRTVEEWEKKEGRERGRRRKAVEGLKAKGIEYEFEVPELRAPKIGDVQVVVFGPPAVVQPVVEEAAEAVEAVAGDDGIKEMEVQVVVKKGKKAKAQKPPAKSSPPVKVKKSVKKSAKKSKA